MKNKTDIGDYIRENFEKLGLPSLQELATQVGVSRRTLYNWIESGTEIKISNLLRLSKVLQVHPVVLLRVVSRDFISYPVYSHPKKRFDDGGFISETIPDDSLVGCGARFEKEWCMQNIGNTTWEGRKLVCQDQNEPLYVKRGSEYLPFHSCLLTPESQEIIIPKTEPQEKVTLRMKFTAPILPDRAVSIWKVVDENNKICYPEKPGYWCQVVVTGFY